MRKVLFCVFVMILLLGGPAVSGQEVSLVSFGSFVYPFPTVVIGGIESYAIECSEKEGECRDNVGNIWPFGDNLDDRYVMMCPTFWDPVVSNCVHSITVSIDVTRRYISSNLRFHRFRASVHDLFFDGEFIARGRSVCGLGMMADNTYNLGPLTPGRPHTISMTASLTSNPYCGNPSEFILIRAFALNAVPGPGNGP